MSHLHSLALARQGKCACWCTLATGASAVECCEDSVRLSEAAKRPHWRGDCFASLAMTFLNAFIPAAAPCGCLNTAVAATKAVAPASFTFLMFSTLIPPSTWI